MRGFTITARACINKSCFSGKAVPPCAIMFVRSLITLATLATSALALVHGTDSSTLVSVATFTKAKGEGFTKAVLRGYQEACGSGGRVDPNFVASYNNARSAGITDIDTYWFPCTVRNIMQFLYNMTLMPLY